MSKFAFSNPVFQEGNPQNVATYPGNPQAAAQPYPPAAGQAYPPPAAGAYPPPPAGAYPPPAAQQSGQDWMATSQNAAFSQQAQNAAFQAEMEGRFAAPPAGAIETDRMSIEDTIWKTVGLFMITIAFSAVSWVITLGGVRFDPARGATMAPMLIGAIVGLVLALVIQFTSRKKVRPALIFAYAAFEGLFIGGISAVFEAIYPGIVTQATLATFAVVGVTLALFASGKIRASAKMTKIFMIAMVGYLVFSLLNLVLMWTGVAGGEFGLRSVTIAGIPLGVIIGILVVFMAAYSLVLDFDMIQQGVRNGAPRVYGWIGAFGILVTVVWLYIEILRMIAILRGNN